jgi:putative endonuclease
MVDRRGRGDHWERVAESFLRSRGLKTLHRNYQVRSGEIDLVLLDGQTLVFTEVRYRGNTACGGAEESVDGHKQRRIVSAAELYLQRHERQAVRPCRFDVVSIGSEGGRTVLNWIRDAFEAT